MKNSYYNLRISLSDICQHKCHYCLPKKDHFLENNYYFIYEKIAKILSCINIKKIRFTGGEPLMNKNFFLIVNNIKKYFYDVELALTTNAQNLINNIENIVKLKINKINIHIDTLDNKKYNFYCKGNLFNIFKCINQLKNLNLHLKINCVVQKNFNDDELLDFLYFSKEYNLEVRFIELINTGISRNYLLKSFVSSEEILKILSKYSKIKLIGRKNSHEPSLKYNFSFLNVDFGVISSSSLPFCLECNRIRISYDLFLKNCLYEKNGLELKELIYLNNFKKVKEKLFFFINNKKNFNPKNLNLEFKGHNSFSMSEIGG